LAIPAERVRCTSVAGYKLSGGAKTDSEITKEIRGTQCFIGLITPNSLQSQFVLFELGARWGLDEHLVPILGGGVTAKLLRPPLSNLNALNSSSKSDMEQLVQELAKVLNKTIPVPDIYQTQLLALLQSNVARSKSPKPKRIRPAQKMRSQRPDWHRFVSDQIFGVLWRWGYTGNSINDNVLSGFCPKQGCMNRLDIDFDSQNPNAAKNFDTIPETMTCSRCGFKRHFDCDRQTLQVKVIHEIERLINTGQYVQRLEFGS
jgi:hypothetical protein